MGLCDALKNNYWRKGRGGEGGWSTPFIHALRKRVQKKILGVFTAGEMGLKKKNFQAGYQSRSFGGNQDKVKRVHIEVLPLFGLEEISNSWVLARRKMS